MIPKGENLELFFTASPSVSKFHTRKLMHNIFSFSYTAGQINVSAGFLFKLYTNSEAKVSVRKFFHLILAGGRKYERSIRKIEVYTENNSKVLVVLIAGYK